MPALQEFMRQEDYRKLYHRELTITCRCWIRRSLMSGRFIREQSQLAGRVTRIRSCSSRSCSSLFLLPQAGRVQRWQSNKRFRIYEFEIRKIKKSCVHLVSLDTRSRSTCVNMRHEAGVLHKSCSNSREREQARRNYSQAHEKMVKKIAARSSTRNFVRASMPVSL